MRARIRTLARLLAVLAAAGALARAHAQAAEVDAPGSATAWTLDRALQTALENNPEAHIAHHRLAAAAALVQQARATMLPQVGISVGYSRTNSPMMAFGSILNQRAFEFGMDFNHPGTIDNLGASGTVGLNLYSGGRTTAGLRAARAGLAAADHDVMATRHQLLGATVAAYLDILKAREAVRAVEAGVRAFEAAVAQGRARFDVGQLLKADLLDLEVQLASTRESAIAARHAQALAERVFLLVLGRESHGGSLTVREDDPALDRLSPPNGHEVGERPEWFAMHQRVRAAEAMVRVARGAAYPEINAFGGVQHDRGRRTDGNGDSWIAGVSVQLDVFDGGTIAGKIRRAEADLAEARAQLRRLELGLALEVERARLACEHAVARVEFSDTRVAQAEESANLSRARFQQGALLAADLIGVESRLIEAHMSRAVATADRRRAIAEWRRAVGLEPLSPTAPPETFPSP